MDDKAKIGVVYTAYSKSNFFARQMISAYVLQENKLPLNPFTNWDYFMADMVDRQLTVRANNNLIYLANAVWQFGAVANGCYHELKLAMQLGQQIRFFSVGKTLQAIREISVDEVEFEEELQKMIKVKKFRAELKEYLQK